MRTRHAWRFIAAILLGMAAIAGAAAPEPLVVMTFNIRYGTANDGPDRWELRRDQLFDVVKSQAPDVIGLQEALHFQIDEILAAVPGYAMVGVGRSDGGQGGEYSAVLYRTSRLAVRRTNTFWFSDTPEVVKSNTWGAALERICTWALFDDRQGTPFYLYNLHLDHVSQPAREKSVALLLARIADRAPALPVVVTGDFNTGETNPATLAMTRVLRDTFRVAHPEATEVGTSNQFRFGMTTGEKIDYIFVEPATEVVSAEIVRTAVKGRYPSDHFPVVARVRLRGESPIVAGPQSTPSIRTTDRLANWPQFRGPHSNPVSENPNLPATWSKTENVEWVAEVPGVGWSSPVVWGTKVFLTAATSDRPQKAPSLGTEFSNEYIAELRKQGLSGDELNKRLWARDREMPDDLVISLMLYCYDLESGKKLWERQIYHGRPRGGRHVKNSFASETPVTDGERVYAYFTDYGLYAFDFDGKPVWTTPFERRETIRDYGTGASPALHRDRLFVLNDNEEQSYLAAHDARTGRELWRTPRTVEPVRKTGWSTPYVWENRVRTEVVTLGPGVAISYGLDGKELWRINRMGGVAIQSPFASNDVLYLTSGTSGDNNKPIVAIRPGGSGDITPREPDTRNEFVLWYERIAGGTYLPTPVLYKDALFVLYDRGIFSRFRTETGERVYRSRIAPEAWAFTASPWAYNGKVFLLSEEGNTYVVDAGEEFRLLGVNSLDEFTLATPAIAGNRLLIRTRSHLYSIRHRR